MASVIVYVGIWLIGSVFGRMLLEALSRPGRTLSWYAPIVWTLCGVLFVVVQVGVLWACGVRSVRSIALRAVASAALTAALFVLVGLLLKLFDGDVASHLFRIVTAAAGIVLPLIVAGIAAALSLVPQRVVEQRYRADGAS